MKRIFCDVDQEAPVEVDVFLIGEKSIAKWISGDCRYGSNGVRLFPVFTTDGRGFLVEENWDAADGYCAEGISESIISFDAGIKLLCNHGKFPWLQTGG